MTVRLDSYAVYANLDAGWTAIQSDIISEIALSWGISGTTPNDRLADTGTMNFTLLNMDGAYTTGEATALAGWKKGAQVKLVKVYGGEPFTKFFGVLDGIRLSSNLAGYTTAEVTVVDWMNYAAEHPIITPALQANKRADEAINLVLDSMPIKPIAKNLETGLNTFPSVFDVVRKKGMAYSEFSTIVDSELGYLYLRKEQGSGEELRFEDAWHRSGLTAFSQVPTTGVDHLLLETGDHILLESGSRIYLNKTQEVAFAGTMIDLEVDHGANQANRISVTAYPRKVDVSLVVLYSLGSPMEIGNGETKTFTGSYSDPVGGQGAGGFGMVEPVATTDYLLNTASDGSGTNLTSSAVVSVTFGGNSASISVKNTSITAGYITFFRIRGYGVYTYAETELAIEDTSSINEYGYFERSFNQQYQGSLTNGEAGVKTQLYLDRIPRTVLQSITFLANSSDAAMWAFLSLDVGSLVNISETQMGISGGYFIQNVAFTVQVGGLIFCTWGLVEHWSYLAGGLTPLTLDMAGGTSVDAVNYGYLPQVVQTSERSYAAWVYDDGAAEDGAVLCAPFSDGGGVKIHVSSLQRVRVYSNLFNANPGWWHSPTNSLLTGAWYHVVVTYDAWSTSANPVIYINAVSQTVTETDTPSGTLNSEFGAEVVVGNQHTDTQNYNQAWHGYLKDVRIYNRILTSTEVTTLYNSGTPDASLVPDGLVFQGPCVTSKENDTEWDTVTTAEYEKFIENIYRAVGVAIAPTISTPPVP